MADSPMRHLDPELASRVATLALGHVTRQYPNKLDHVLNGPHDVRTPVELHPIFYGSFDWHSCVHGYWLLARLYRRFSGLAEANAIRDLLNAQLTDANVAGELAYLSQPLRGTFERPYGWGWLLMLAAELRQHTTDDGRRRSNSFAPLADAFARRFLDFLPKATYPIRVGTHFNTAFATRLALDYARVADEPLARAIRDAARRWYSNDADCQAWEPGGDDFLSSALIEAECMRCILPIQEYSTWLDRFLPRLDRHEPATLFTPAIVSDRTDGKIGHLNGLNLSRAWCWRSIASTWPANDPRRALALDAAERHLAASLPHVAGDYAGEHWLATFAVMALDASDSSAETRLA
jgi:hypothetical protein